MDVLPKKCKKREVRCRLGTEWMGRYRPLVAQLVRHSNVVQRASTRRTPLAEGIALTPPEGQVFEYILEHQEDDACMNCISERLGLAQSTFSKITKYLCELGLVDKYQAESNRKNIILRPSELGIELYARHSADIDREMFGSFFEALSSLGDEQLAQFTAALETLNRTIARREDKSEPVRLIKKT